MGSIFDQTRELLKSLKSKASSVANILPPVQAYNAVKTGINTLNRITPGGIQGGVQRVQQSFRQPQQYFMPTAPQARQTVQNIANFGSALSQRGAQLGQQVGQRIQNTPQLSMGPIQDFKSSLIRKAAPAVLGMAGSIPGEFIRGIAQSGREVMEPSRFIKAPLYTKGNILGTPQSPTKAGIAFDVATSAPDVTDLAKYATLGGFGAGILKSQLDAKALKQFLPEIRNVSKMLGNMDDIPFLTPQQLKAAEGIVEKIRGSNSIKQLQKLNPNTKDYLNSLRVILGGAEDQILNPKLNIGFTTKAINTPRATPEEIARQNFNKMWQEKYGNRPTKIKTDTALDQQNAGKILQQEKSAYIQSKVGDLKSYSQQDIDDYNRRVKIATKEFEESKKLSTKGVESGLGDIYNPKREEAYTVFNDAKSEASQLFKKYMPEMERQNKGFPLVASKADIKRSVELEKIMDKSLVEMKATLPRPSVSAPLTSKESIVSKNPTPEVPISHRPIISQPPLTKGVESMPVKKTEEISGRKLPQSEVSATTELQKPISQVETPTVVGAGAGKPSSEDIITDPIQKVISLLQEAKPMNEQQLALYKAERSRRAGAVAGIGKSVRGEGGYFAQLKALKGELPKVQFERIRNGLKQTDIDTLFNKVEDANITPFEKISAKSGLAKLLGAEGGQIPVKSEIALLSEIFPPEFIQAIQAKRPFMERLWSGIEGALNLPRSIMATADLSAPLRQGFFFISRPKQWAPAFKDMFKYAGSEKAYLGLMDDIKARPNYLKMREAKLALTDMSPNLLSREEEFMSNLVEKIPGFGALAKGSNRAYSGFLNKLRADVFDDLVSKAEMQGIKLDGKVLEDLGSFINSATGRGNLGKTMQKAAPILNGVFFSPRLMASRINLLNPATYVKYDPFVRKEALKSLIGTGTIAASILGLASLAGAEVGKDPRSADFGKIKIGNTRYDMLGGFQQYIKLMAQLATGQVVSSTTGKVITLGEGYKPLTRKDILMRFFEAKTSPVASFIISLITGQTGVGEPVNVPTEIINRFIPMMAQDIYDIAKDKDSVGKGLLMAIPGIFGAGSQTYGKSEFVEGTNKVGQPTSQIRPVQGLAETISEKAFGKQPLGSSSTYNIQTFIEQMKSLSPQEQETQWKRIVQTNPELAKKIKQVVSDEKKGITVQNQTLKEKGVASGDRATAVAKEFKKLKTPEEKAALWEDYVKKGIITKDVAKQLKILLSQ